jgi:hypothetical protein
MNGLTIALILVLATSMSTVALAQGTTQPSQPVDPTAQTPGSPIPEGPIPSTPPTFPTPEAKGGASGTKPTSSSSTTTSAKPRPFIGTVVQSQAGYVLRSGDLVYKLDDQDRAKAFQGKNVKVTGSLDKRNNTIHMRTIEPSPSS